MQICKSEGVNVTVPQLKHVIDICLGDIRRTVMLLQFWYQGRHQFTGLMLYREKLSIFFCSYVVLAHCSLLLDLSVCKTYYASFSLYLLLQLVCEPLLNYV